MVNVEWALRSAWFLNTNLSNLTNFSPRGGFVFPHGSHGSHGFLLLRSFFLWGIVRTVACNEEDPWDLWDPCATSLSESHCKDTTFHFPNSPMLIVAHRYSPIITVNIKVLPNGRKYRILAGDWTPCCSWCIHSSAAAHRAGCILLSISSDGLLPHPGRNPENRAGLTPAWCNFVNPFSIMLNVECWMLILNTNLSNLTNLSFWSHLFV